MGGSEFVALLVAGTIGGLVSGGVTWFVTRRVMLHQLREDRADRRGEAVRAAWQPFDQACRLELPGHRLAPDRAAVLDSLLGALRAAGASQRAVDLAERIRGDFDARQAMDPGRLLVHGGGPTPPDMRAKQEAVAAATRALGERLAELERAVGEETRAG